MTGMDMSQITHCKGSWQSCSTASASWPSTAVCTSHPSRFRARAIWRRRGLESSTSKTCSCCPSEMDRWPAMPPVKGRLCCGLPAVGVCLRSRHASPTNQFKWLSKTTPGKDRVKVLPLPTPFDMTVRSPPWLCSSSFISHRPSPVPFCCCPERRREKGRNNESSSSSLMPRPWSETLIEMRMLRPGSRGATSGWTPTAVACSGAGCTEGLSPWPLWALGWTGTARDSIGSRNGRVSSPEPRSKSQSAAARETRSHTASLTEISMEAEPSSVTGCPPSRTLVVPYFRAFVKRFMRTCRTVDALTGENMRKPVLAKDCSGASSFTECNLPSGSFTVTPPVMCGSSTSYDMMS